MFYKRCVRPLLFALPPETAHAFVLRALPFLPHRKHADPPALETTLWGHTLPNPLGLAAGFDKNAIGVKSLAALGFAAVETGGVTPLPQPGNPKPRLWRFPEQNAIVNAMGFNNKGAEAVAKTLAAYKNRSYLLGVNIAPNKTSNDWFNDYLVAWRTLAPHVDYVSVNVSSPNTPGLRALQQTDVLDQLLQKLADARTGDARKPLVLKISPDSDDKTLADLAALALKHNIDGLIISNTTTARPEGIDATLPGGLSGAPLFEHSTNVLRNVYIATQGKIPLIGAGGVTSGAEAYAKIRAGATLVQFYTGLVYKGPGLVRSIKNDLVNLLARDGFTGVQQAVGQP